MSGKSISINNVQNLPINKIRVSHCNVRASDKDKGVDELADSISQYGLFQPVVVLKKGNEFSLVIGQRRLRAFKNLRMNEIPAIVLPENIKEENLKILSLSENIHRVELNRADIVEVISYLYKNYNRSAKKVAKTLGKSVSYIYDHLKIQDAPREVMDMLSRKEINKEDVKRVMEIAPGNESEMIKVAKKMKKLTPYERKRIVEIKRAKPKEKVDVLLEEAKKPHIEEKIIVPLPPTLLKALDSAAKSIGLSREEIIKKVLQDWLGNKGFYKG